MVGGEAPLFGEVVVALPHGVDQVAEGGDLPVEPLAHPVDVLSPAGCEDLHRLVGAPGRTDDPAAEGGVGALVIFEQVHRVVGRTHRLDVQRTGQQRLRPEGVGGELLVDRVPDLFAALFGEPLIDAEVALEVEMDPFIDRIADDFGEHLRHGEELLLGGGFAAGDQRFGHAALAQHLPDVVVGGGEELPGVGVAGVVGDFADIRVVVRVDDREILDLVEDPFSGRVADEVVVIEKSHDSSLLALTFCYTLTASAVAASSS